MARRLLWIGFGVFGAGALLAFFLRISNPLTMLKFGFQTDRALLVLAIALLIALGFIATGYLLRRQNEFTEHMLADQAAEFEDEQRRFIHRLDHELKNPLTAIQIHLDNIQESAADDQSAIADVRAQANRLALLTRGLRSLADLETRPLDVEPVDVDELLKEVVEFLEAPDRIKLDVQKLPWAIPPIQGDRELLLMAFRNLAQNALIYSTDSIEIRARHTTGDLVVEVIDTGRGIPPRELALVTEELYRGSNVHEISGSGLGLSIVERIISRHNGRLELRSRSGQGTIASVQLPYEQTESR